MVLSFLLLHFGLRCSKKVSFVMFFFLHFSERTARRGLCSVAFTWSPHLEPSATSSQSNSSVAFGGMGPTGDPPSLRTSQKTGTYVSYWNHIRIFIIVYIVIVSNIASQISYCRFDYSTSFSIQNMLLAEMAGNITSATYSSGSIAQLGWDFQLPRWKYPWENDITSWEYFSVLQWYIYRSYIVDEFRAFHVVLFDIPTADSKRFGQGTAFRPHAWSKCPHPIPRWLVQYPRRTLRAHLLRALEDRNSLKKWGDQKRMTSNLTE